MTTALKEHRTHNESAAKEHLSSLKSMSELCACLRDVAVTAAVFLYFVGFVYIYSYYETFDMSLIVTQIPPWYALTFSYNVIDASPLITCAFVVALAAATWGYLRFLRFERRRHVRLRYKLVAHCGAFITVALSFTLGYFWAVQVADDAATFVRKQAHELAQVHVRIVPILQGSEQPTTAFSALLADVNQAGIEGRAMPVGESADRLYIFVGAPLHNRQRPEQKLEGDHVVSLDKSRLALEESE